jgi:anti-sigma regulatory factor (Ser/Thr protein kinase)
MTATTPLVQLFPADPSALSDVRKFVLARAEEAALPGHVSDDLLVAVTEAFSDMLAHEKCATMAVSWWVHDGVAEIILKDLGVTGKVVPIPDTDDEKDEGDENDEALFEGRLAFPYIFEFVDEFEVLPGRPDDPGTVVRLVRETSAA